jgi:Xaa-Pro dipeptidase
MAGAGNGFARLGAQLDALQRELAAADLDGWLLYDLKGRNPIAGGLLGLGDLSRRYFVFVPRAGEPVAITHAIEPAPWAEWAWPKHVYAAWRDLERLLAEVLPRGGRIAMEYSERDAVPILDLVPAGVIELVRASGATVVTSGDLVTRFYSRWSRDDVASHRRTAAVLADVAAAAFARLGRGVTAGEPITEDGLRGWVLGELAARGAGVGADCMVATGTNAANPHYTPIGEGATFARGDVVLLDLWSKEAEDAVYADQTWMGYLGVQVPERAAELFAAARDARDAAVRFVEDAWRADRSITGAAVDDVARAVIEQRGLGRYFLHRTGHSIDRATHGAGPNIDNHETHEVRRLIPGIGFSIEPGIYIAGEIGLRTEINVYMSEDGPEVTTPRIQTGIAALLAE